MGRELYEIENDEFRLRLDPSAGWVRDMEGAGEKSLLAGPGDPGTLSEFHDAGFHPQCLTVYVNTRCNLRCDYCYDSGNRTRPERNVSLNAVRAAAEVVAARCKAMTRPFVLGFHGGNEPLLSRALVGGIIACCRKVAAGHGLQVLSFCTTNGVIDRAAAEWAARTFDGITLSWDGCREIHDMHRRHADGRPSYEEVAETADVFRSIDANRVTIRVTVTRNSVDRMRETAEFFHDLGFRTIHFFPVYRAANGTLDEKLAVDQSSFVFNFLKARSWAKPRAMRLIYSGTRWSENHDRFCMLRQNNLTMTPDGYLTACFLATSNHEQENGRFVYGSYDERTGKLSIDRPKLASIVARLRHVPLQCEDCYNRSHCAKNCPSLCPLSEPEHDAEFECTVFKWLGLANIIEAAGHVVELSTREECIDYFTNIRISRVPADRCDERVRHIN